MKQYKFITDEYIVLEINELNASWELPTFSSLSPVAVDCTLVVKRSEAIRALKELALSPTQVVGLDVHRAGVLVLELSLTHRAGH